jgi:hypothetical protein
MPHTTQRQTNSSTLDYYSTRAVCDGELWSGGKWRKITELRIGINKKVFALGLFPRR